MTRPMTRPVTRPVPRQRGGTDSFEATYPRYEFSELVRLGVGLARLIAGVRRRRPAHGRMAADGGMAADVPACSWSEQERGREAPLSLMAPDDPTVNRT